MNPAGVPFQDDFNARTEYSFWIKSVKSMLFMSMTWEQYVCLYGGHGHGNSKSLLDEMNQGTLTKVVKAMRSGGANYRNVHFRDVSRIFEWKLFKTVMTIRNMSSHVGHMIAHGHNVDRKNHKILCRLYSNVVSVLSIMRGNTGTFELWSQEHSADYNSTWSVLRSMRMDVVTVSHTKQTAAFCCALIKNFNMNFQLHAINDADNAFISFNEEDISLEDAVGAGFPLQNVPFTDESLEFFRHTTLETD